ncbi:MAG: protein kinase domain-containing protein [Planctomycetaceae bacterium]
MDHIRFQKLRDQALDSLVTGHSTAAEYQQVLQQIDAAESAARAADAEREALYRRRANPNDGLSSLPTMIRPAEPPPPVQPVKDMLISKYRLEASQRGGMGVVWKAWDTKGERWVALKFLPPELQGNDDEIARIRATFKLVEQLDHAHICRVFDLDEHPDFGWFQVMRWIEGQTLSGYRRDADDQVRCLSVAEVAELLEPVAEALDYAHSRKVLHRDIKPQNLMRDERGHVSLLDFGLAAEVRSSLTRLSKSAIDLTGTQPYLAPELWEGGYATQKTDQYALGLMAYELLAGRYPFNADNPLILMQAVLNKPVPAINGLLSGVMAVLQRCLARNPAERFANCHDFAAALKKDQFLAVSESVAAMTTDDPDYLQALSLAFGIGSPIDGPEARRLFRVAAERGHTLAMTFVGDIFINGEGTPVDKDEGTKWYCWSMPKLQRLAERGDPIAQVQFGCMIEQGLGVEANGKLGVEWIAKAATQGHWMAQCNLGVMYQNGRGVGQNDDEAVRWYRKAADQNHAPAQNNLGWMYWEGRGVAQNDTEAARWTRKAADQNFAPAQQSLGWMYREGRGVAQDDVEAVRWSRKAADQNDVHAQSFLGYMYEEGRGVAQNDVEAVHWYRKAADQNFAPAQQTLGVMYADGRGVAMNDREAARWYRKAADQNHAFAQYCLGNMYADGRGIAQNEGEAVRWYRKAADQNLAPAQHRLGGMYEEGRGVAQNDAEAGYWFRKAADQNFAAAQIHLAAIDATHLLRRLGLR